MYCGSNICLHHAWCTTQLWTWWAPCSGAEASFTPTARHVQAWRSSIVSASWAKPQQHSYMYTHGHSPFSMPPADLSKPNAAETRWAFLPLLTAALATL